MGGPSGARHAVAMQVFLVEDSPLIRDRLTTLLAGVPHTHVMGYAGDADNAIRQILDSRPDVVLLDLSLAEGTGFDVLRAVRPAAPQIDFYMLSNFAADPYRQLAERLGACQFFDKSCEFDVVRAVITQRAAGKQ